MLINNMQILIWKTIWQQITDGQEQVNVGGKLMNSRAYVAKFNFSGSDQTKGRYFQVVSVIDCI